MTTRKQQKSPNLCTHTLNSTKHTDVLVYFIIPEKYKNYINYVNKRALKHKGFYFELTWRWSMVSYRMMFDDHFTAGSNTTKVNGWIHGEQTHPGRPEPKKNIKQLFKDDFTDFQIMRETYTNSGIEMVSSSSTWTWTQSLISSSDSGENFRETLTDRPEARETAPHGGSSWNTWGGNGQVSCFSNWRCAHFRSALQHNWLRKV